MKKTPVIECCRSLLILLFTYAAASKLVDFQNFKDILQESTLIHSRAGTIVWLVPVTELVVVLLLFFPKTRLMGFYGSGGLLVAFTVYLSYLTLYQIHLPCNCGGVLKQLSWTQHIFFNLFFIGLSLSGIFLTKCKRPVQTPGPT